MPSRNPYAPSTASLHAGEKAVPVSEARADGKWVVVPIGGSLPHRCVKCNGTPHDPTRVRTVYWHHGAIYLVLLLNVVIYLVVAAVVRKSVTVAPALCREHKRRRRNIILLAWAGGIASFVLPMAFGTDRTMVPWLLFSMLLCLASIIFGLVRSRIVYAKRIDKQQSWLGGCGENFLDSLPRA